MSAAEKIDIFIPRRFQMPDLNTHGGWMLPRLETAFNMNERMAASWLRSLIYSNESLFLFHGVGVALAQVETINTLQPRPVVRERFVWLREPEDKEAQKQGAQFYDLFSAWAKNQNADIMIVQELTDIPPDLVKAKLGRIFIREQKFTRL
jgi:hypothetical protein